MTHPSTAKGGWELAEIVYGEKFAGIAVALMRHEKRSGLALRWLPSREATDKNGETRSIGSWMDGETDWFILPFDFAISIGRMLIERKVAGSGGFSDNGFRAMIEWLVDEGGIDSAVCY
jgi:hypothetical protein